MKVTILYERLSRDDEQYGESNSIQNQKMLLETYAKNNSFGQVVHLWDDGVSGTTFDRPGFNKMMDMVEEGIVSVICVKDMSRLGRDYLRVGLIMESLSAKNVRLIAINNGVDTIGGKEDDFTVFRNVINEWYARDTSRKIRAVQKARGLEGKHVSPSTPYGYLRDKDDKQKWVIDEPAAEVVRRIFKMVIDGKGVTYIAKILTAEKVLCPAAHEVAAGSDTRHRYSDPYYWHTNAVSRIIDCKEYLGHTVSFKYTTESYKSRKLIKNPVEKRMIFENTHEAIIDEETWLTAQKARQTARRNPKRGETPKNRLTGLLYCADCGRKMYYHGSAEALPSKHAKNHYICSNYRQRLDCSMHYIRVPAIEELIKGTLKTVSKYARENESGFIEKVRAAYNAKAASTIKEYKKQITKAEKRQDELDSIVKKLLEANAADRIPDSHFDKMFAGYANEQDDLEKRIDELKTLVVSYESDSARADKFLELVNKYTDFDIITTTMLNELVDKIIVHEADKSSGKRTQKVDIHFNFIGNFVVPDYETILSPEQIEANEKLEERRAYCREKMRNYRSRQKAKSVSEKIESETAV